MVNVLIMNKIIIFIPFVLLLFSCAVQKKIEPILSFEDLNYPYEVNKLKINDELTIAYMDEGEGEIILFVHGLGSYAPAWKKNVEALKKSYRCIAIDLPGYGMSSKGNFEGSMSYYADIINAVAQKLNIEKLTLAGHSMGGQISIMAALAYPQLVKGLVLVSPAGFETFTAGQKQWFREVVTPKSVMLTPVDNIISNIGSNFYDFPDEAQFMIDDRIAMRSAASFDLYCHQIVKSIHGMVDQPVIEYLEDINVPTLIVFGKQDNLIPNRFLNPGKTIVVAQMGSSKIKQSKLVMVDKAGHFVHFEQDEEVNRVITEFLNN